ncbi:MAG: META domain-containing protein [Alphaproteobacteria bacterium]|nr:META domain-containing protein [Alphaproteobacteria bacterium]
MRSALLAALLLLGACGTSQTQQEPTHYLSGTKWLRMDDLDANPHGATMDFIGNRAAGYTGCNRWTADVTEQGEELRFGMVATTEMACTSPMQRDTERNFLRVLERTRYAHFDQESLVLMDSRQRQIAQFNSNLPTPE